MMGIIDRIRELKKQKKQNQEQIKQIDNPQSKDNLQRNNDELNIDLQYQELQKAREDKAQREKKELVEETYLIIKKVLNIFNKLGLAKTKTEICEMMGKSRQYLTTLENKQRIPSFESLSNLKMNIFEIKNNIDLLMYDSDLYNKENIKRVLGNLYESLDNLQQKIVMKIYKL